MNIQNLSEGLIVKNYKELCGLLGVEEKAGNTKQSQLKEFSRFVDYEKDKHQFIIKEIYSDPKDKIDKRIGNNKEGKNNSKYIDEITDILVNYIYKNRDLSGKIVLTFSKLISILGLANDTYDIGMYRKKELSDILNVELKAVYYFYNNTRSEFKKIIERALNNLKKRSVIHYNKIVMIAEETGKYTKDNKKILNYRYAETEEIEMILDTQRMVLEYLEIPDLQSLLLSGSVKYKEFNDLVMMELPKKWVYYFNAYELVVGQYAIKSEYNIVQQRRIELNNKSIERISKSLKVCNDIDVEKQLIDILIDLYKHDFGLDEKIKELYEQRQKEKYNKLKENNKKLSQLTKEKMDIEIDNEVTIKLFDERDKVSKYDLYTYAKKIKNRAKENEVTQIQNFEIADSELDYLF